MSGSWPASLPIPQHVFREDFRFETVRTPFEAGYVQTFARWTIGKKTFSLQWNVMFDDDFRTLRTFMTAQRAGAGSFNWTHPVDGTVHTVRFADDSLSWELVGPGKRRVAVTLEEV